MYSRRNNLPRASSGDVGLLKSTPYDQHRAYSAIPPKQAYTVPGPTNGAVPVSLSLAENTYLVWYRLAVHLLGIVPKLKKSTAEGTDVTPHPSY